MKIRTRSYSVSRVFPAYLWGPRMTSILFLFLSLGLFFVTAFHPASFNATRTSIMDVFSPVLAAVNRPIQASADYIRAVSGIAQLQTENHRLKQENIRLRDWYQTALLLKAENQSLQELLNMQLPPAHSYITARVIGDSGNAYVKTLLILAGKSNGVAKGQAVLSSEGLIGRIVETGNRASRLLLLTDMNSRIPVMIEKSNWRAIMAGNNEEQPRLLHLPADSKVKDGMKVVTSGHGGLFPPGIEVGTIKLNIDGNIYVQLSSRMERVTYVRIINQSSYPNLRLGTSLD